MKIENIIDFSLVLLGIFLAILAFGGDFALGQSGKRRPGPPPEAYTTCEGKSAGDEAQFVSPRGDTVAGTCKQMGNGLVLVPDHMKVVSSGKPIDNIQDPSE